MHLFLFYSHWQKQRIPLWQTFWYHKNASWIMNFCRNLENEKIPQWESLLTSFSSYQYIHKEVSPVFIQGKEAIALPNQWAENSRKCPNLWKAIQKDFYPKKIKFHLWELNHTCLNTLDRLQRSFWWALSTKCCSLCKSNSESQKHNNFTQCLIASKIWSHLLTRSIWTWTDPIKVQDWLSLILIEHPFRVEKKITFL